MPRDTRSTKETRARAILSGLQEHFDARRVYRLRGVAYTRDAIAAVYRAQLEALEAVRRAHLALRQAVRVERRATRKADAVTAPLKLTIRSQYGEKIEVLASFGWSPAKKPGPKTVRAKARMVEKAAATRARRGARR